jgi:VanZ family protein
MPLALFWRYRAITQKQFILRIFLIIFLLCSAFLISALPEERLHFLTYGLAGWLLCWSLEAWLVKIYSAKPSEKMNLLMAWLLPCFLVWLAGGVDELIQWWLPNRVFDIRDIIFNGTAGMTGIALFATGSRKSKENSATSLP